MTDNASAGATPVVAGATPTQTADTTAAPTASAMGDPEALGEAGKRALDAMKLERNDAVKASRALQARLEELENASKSETDKAIAQAKKDGAAEVLVRVQAQVRRSEVRTALIAQGINANVLDLAAKADEFGALEVTDDGDVTGLAEAVKAFKAARPDLFTKAPPVGTADGGNRGGGSSLTKEAIRKMSPTEINERWDEVSKVLAAR